MSDSRLDRAHAAFELDALFPDEAPLTAVPWRRGAPLGRRTADERAAVQALVATAPCTHQFVDLDPTQLSASQPSLTRAGVAHYLTSEYRRSGRTYADQYEPGNKYPIVLARGDDLVVLSGHHRAAAALLLGEALRARVASSHQLVETSDGFAVTAALFVGEAAPAAAHEECADRGAAEVWINLGATAWLPSATDHDIRHLAYELGVEPAWMRHQLHFARTGRIRLPDHQAEPPQKGEQR